MTFDARAAKLLKPGEHITLEAHPGLRLVATEQFRTWVYRYKSPATNLMKQVKLGRWPELSYHAAVTAWEKARLERDQGKDIAAEKKVERVELRAAAEVKRQRQRAESYTVARLADDYCAHVSRVRKEKGAKEVRRTFDKMLGPIADVTAASLTRAQAFDLLELYVDTPVQCGKLRAELAAAWDHALDAGRLPDNAPNWWRQVMRGKLKSKGKKINGEAVGTEKRALSREEMKDLIAWMPNFSRNVGDVLTLYLWTGARGSEIVQMEAGEVKLEKGVLWWTCPKRKTKNARHENATDFRVPLFGKAREIVERRIANYKTGHLFRPVMSKDEHIQQKVIQTAVYYHMPYSMTSPERERPRLTVTRWAPHDLRRTVRTHLAAMGCPNEVAEVALGHMLKGVEGVYNRHTYDAEKAEWLKRWSDLLASLS